MILGGFTEIPKGTLILVTFFLNKSVAYLALHLIELDRQQYNRAHALYILDNYGYRHTLRICNTYYLPRQQWLRERASMLRYTYISCVF